MNRLQTGVLLALIPILGWADAASDAAMFNDDWESRAAEVSEGELAWQPGPVSAQTPRVTIQIDLDPEAAKSGWQTVRQCHEPLDPVPAAQLVFTGRQVRSLQVQSYERIDQVTVQGEQVEMVGIAAGARLCVLSEQQIIHPLPGGLLAVIAGPYQRRFLDGYYPQGIEISLRYPADRVRFERLYPPGLSEQAGVSKEPGLVHFSAHVAGRLKFAFVFRPVRPGRLSEQ